MSKSNSGLFKGTLGTTYLDSTSKLTSYTDRGIEIPKIIKEALNSLSKSGNYIIANKLSEKEISIMSKETGVEFASVTIGNKTYVIRGNEYGTDIPDSIIKDMIKNKGTLDFHSHPHDDDCIPSCSDRKLMGRLNKITGQETSYIVTPNGKTVLFNSNGIVSTGTVENKITNDMKKLYMDLFGGKK